MIRRNSGRWAALLAVLALAACNSASETNPTAGQPTPTATSVTTAPLIVRPGALFYTKAGSLYVSEPAGTPGRKLTDGPADTQPAPSPDLSHVAFVRKTTAADYGGELWVLDLSPQLAPVGAPRRLVDPAALPSGPGRSPATVIRPRWSPTGQHVAFVDNRNDGMVDGGVLVIADADTGAVVPAQQPPFADSEFAWAPDGRHIAWTEARSDVSPVTINVLAVDGGSVPVAADTNVFSVTYGKDGRTILFANGDASGPDFTAIPFAVRVGGIYSVAVPGGADTKSPARPTPLFTRKGSYFSDVTAVESGAVAFTAQGADGSSKTIEVIDEGSSIPRTTVTDVAANAQGPAWGAGSFVAYVDTSPESSLMVTDLDNRSPRNVDTAVDAFAWPPAR
ncbi:MAG: hypothetical protein ACM4D3_19990 [Candidatus Sericytochromatia bacterium]